VNRVGAGAAALLLLGAVCACTSPQGPPPLRTPPVFYRPSSVGSEATYDPLSSSMQYVLDSVQVQQFTTDDYSEHLDTVVDHLADPVAAIEREGGWVKFINTQIFPIDPRHLRDSRAILPNVGLHAFGGGLLYRKDAEWFEAHGVAEPYLVSGALAMTSEVLAEAIEKPVTHDTDEIGDAYIWRPIGIWLYSDDDRARWIQKNLDPVDWPNLLMWSVKDGDFANTGVNYIVRPRWFGPGSIRPFVSMGMTTLFGLSHEISEGDAISWGVGTTTLAANPVDLRASAGVYYDRANSLLASVILNGGEAYAVRANVYPGVLFGSALGLFAGLTDDGDFAVGIHYRLPIGLAR
jgi:hypothetical protein